MAYVEGTERGAAYTIEADEWNQNAVRNPSALHTGAMGISGQATGDVIIAASSSQLDTAAPGAAGTVLTSNGVGVLPSFQNATVPNNLCQGRLSLTSGTAVTTADVTAATTLYFALYQGNQVGLYTGSAWQAFALSELSIAIPATTSQMYDVFVDYNGGSPALALTAWTNDTTRATALTTQDGILVLSGSTGKRYVGSCRTTAVSGQTEDSKANRLVWNLNHQQPRDMLVAEATNSWQYTIATYRQANNAATNQLAFVVGVEGVALQAEVRALALGTTAMRATVAIGIDSTTTPATGNLGMTSWVSGTQITQVTASLRTYPAVGYHKAVWLEQGDGSGNTVEWYGDNNAPTLYQSGISGSIQG
jgi:hypothetical protein